MTASTKTTPTSKRGAPTVLTPTVRRQISEYLWLAFTDSQIACLVGISETSFKRFKASEFWTDIQRSALKREAVMRRKIWNGKQGWFGACWMLERLYPTQFAKPEIQLQVNNQIGPQVQNVVILSNKSAIATNERNKTLDAEVTELLQLSNGNGNGDKV